MDSAAITGVLAVAGAAADFNVGGLLHAAASLLAAMARLAAEISRVPEVIASATSKVSIWKAHLNVLQGLSQRTGINDHLRFLLQESGVLGRAQACIERLNDIITEQTLAANHRQTSLSAFYDHTAFRLGRQDEVKKLLQQLDDSIMNLALALNTNVNDAVEALTLANHQRAQADVKDEEADAILNWLEPSFDPKNSDPVSMQIDKFCHQEPDTCIWMVKSLQWQDWFKGGSDAIDSFRRFMWISGFPGTGKTILASFLIDNLGPHQSTYYYCLHERHRNETLPFLRWTVRDLYKQLRRLELECGSAERKISFELHQMWQREQLSTKSLMDCLEVLVKQFHSQHKRRVYIVVDAIDESEEPRDEFLETLTTIGVSPRFGNVSLLITSRPYEDIKLAIAGLKSMTLPSKPLPIRLPHPSPLSPPERAYHSANSSPGPMLEKETSTSWDSAPQGEAMRRTPERRLLTPARAPYRCQEFDTVSTPMRSPRTEVNNVTASGYSRQGEESATSNRSGSAKRARSGGEAQTSPTKRSRQDAGVSPCTTVDMSNPQVEEAIRLYVARQLKGNRTFRRWSPDQLAEVEIRLACKAGGVFRIVACHLDIIRLLKVTEPSKVLESINTMPQSIFESYEKILVEGIRDGEEMNRGEVNRADREFARTALALICSDTSNIPDADVLIEASQTILPQLTAKNYQCATLMSLLGCLVKQDPIPKRRTVFKRNFEGEDSASTSRFSVAHYTVKEFLVSPMAASGPAKYFAVSALTNQRLELKIAFYGLQNFSPIPRGGGYMPTRYEEYCLKLTEKALTQRPVIVEEEKEIWNAVKPCLQVNAPHLKRITHARVRGVIRDNFPKWHSLSPFTGDVVPRKSTSVLVNLLILEWPELARVYLKQLKSAEKQRVWFDKFTLTAPHPKAAMTLAQMCVSRRHLDFLKIFTDGVDGARFQHLPDILYRAMPIPDGKTNGKTDGDSHLVTEELARELLAYSADPNPKGFAVTPLQVATHALQPMLVRHLLAHGAKVDAVGDPEGENPMSSTGDEPDWYLHKPLRICREREIDDIDEEIGGVTEGSRLVVEALLRRYLNGEIGRQDESEVHEQPREVPTGETTIVIDDSDDTTQ